MPQPAAALLDAFEEQMTEDTFRSVLEHARRRAAMIASTDEALALAQDAITDTLGHVTPWEPAASSLAAHLRVVISRGEVDVDDADTDAPHFWRPARREIFELLDFARVRLELAWRGLRGDRSLNGGGEGLRDWPRAVSPPRSVARAAG